MTYASLKRLLTRRFHLPKARSLDRAVRSFSIAERAVFYFFVFLFIGSAVVLLARVNSSFKTDVPVRGGTLTEGIVGNPRFINPVLALSQADKDLSALVYSGLVTFDKDGNLRNDLADKVSVSADGLTYVVHLRDDAIFQDGTRVTADDVVFTIQKIVDPNIKSPLAGDWAGVTVQKVDDRDISFILKKAYAPFENNLAVGLLPKHLWQNVSDDEFPFSELNIQPIGSGPYEVSSVNRDAAGIPNHFELTPFNRYVGGTPYIGTIAFISYPNQQSVIEAYASSNVNAVGGLAAPDAASLKKDGAHIVDAPLPRIFGVFFNQSSNKALLDPNVRKALDLAAPKAAIVSQVLGGQGTALNGPLPPGIVAGVDDTDPRQSDADALAKAAALLKKDGWTKNSSTGVLEKKLKSDTITLSFSLSTGDAPELTQAAALLKSAWQELGAQVSVEVYATGDLNQNIIRPRRFETLLFGEVIGRGADLYPFWHSSERQDPGLNIALYANSTADKLLEATRTDSDPDKRRKDYQSLLSEIESDTPAVFLYSPSYVYAVPAQLGGLNLGSLGGPEDRFEGVSGWYLETASVWNIFVKH